MQRPDPDGAGSLTRPTSTYIYNDVGQLTSEGKPSYIGNGAVQRTYDDAGRLTSMSGPVSGYVVNYTLDNLGRVTKETTQMSGGTDYSYVKYAYNSRGWVTSSTPIHPTASPVIDGTATTYAYDAAGQLTSTTDARGYTTAYAYDARGLVGGKGVRLD